MRSAKGKQDWRQAKYSTSTVESHIDVDWLLRATQNGVEDAEAILVRRVKRTGEDKAVTDLGDAWAEACYSVEALFDLLSAQQLKASQEERFKQFLQRIKRLLPSIRRHQLREPAVNWSEILTTNEHE